MVRAFLDVRRLDTTETHREMVPMGSEIRRVVTCNEADGKVNIRTADLKKNGWLF